MKLHEKKKKKIESDLYKKKGSDHKKEKKMGWIQSVFGGKIKPNKVK